jgi:hypothetical protein
VAALKSAVGRPDVVKFFKATNAAKSFPDLERVVQSAVGRTGLMLFAEFELGDHCRCRRHSADDVLRHHFDIGKCATAVTRHAIILAGPSGRCQSSAQVAP